MEAEPGFSHGMVRAACRLSLAPRLDSAARRSGQTQGEDRRIRLRRQGRTIEQIASEMDDKELQQALMSMGGKYAVLYSIRDSLRGARFNGLSLWIEEHFDESDNGLVLKEGAEEMVQDFLGRVREVSEELKKDDF